MPTPERVVLLEDEEALRLPHQAWPLQLVVAEGRLLLQQVDIGHDRLVALQLAGIEITQQQFEHVSRSGISSTGVAARDPAQGHSRPG
jgi:hypothetical protein